MAETNPNDPSGLLSAAGATNPNIVKIINTARMDLNDSFGLVHNYNADRSRYLVTLLSTDNSIQTANNQTTISLKAENVQKPTFFEKTKIQGTLAYQSIKQQYNDPRVQAELRRHYTSAKDRLGFKPEYLICGLCVLFLMSARLFGVSKVIMASSFSLLVIGVSAPDWYVGRSNLKTSLKNFPNRWRDAIVQTTGFRNLSTNITLGIFVALFLFTAKVLFFSPSYSNYTPSNIAPSSLKYDYTSSPISTTKTTQLLEEMYKFGFQDATNDKPFGASLPENLEALVLDKLPPPQLETEDDLDWNDLPPPINQKPKSNPLGMGTLLSCFTLFRMLKEMATSADEQISFPLLVANIKMADPWKLGIFGMCAYKILSGFLY